MKLDFARILVQAKVDEKPEWRRNADAIVARFPGAEVTVVESHWGLPELFEAPAEDWLESKRRVLVLGVKSSLAHRENGRSADYIAASMSNGCLSACGYCYVARRKGGSNPLTLFMNVEQIADSIERHSRKLGKKPAPNQCDADHWIYDIGCNSDLSLDALVCDHPGYMIERFARMEFAKATFATKTVNEEAWLSRDPKGRTRIRYSLMPTRLSLKVDVGTSPIPMRVRSMNRLVEAGYEVHANFSPIIVGPSDGWKQGWIELFREMDDVLTPAVKEQLACEAFLLTHSVELHEINETWNPAGERFLWAPDRQVPKAGKPDVLTYDPATRRAAIAWFLAALEQYLPYCRVRYVF